MTTASKLQALVDGLEDTRQAIEDKGATLPAGSPLGDYPGAVESIEGGGGTEIPLRSRLTVPGDTDPWHLTSLTATSINGYAFYDDTSLTSVSLPAVTSISNYAFNGCSSLTTADLPSVTSISAYAFYTCSSLTTADLPLVTSISSFAFYGCRSITSVSLPATTSFNSSAFFGCSSLTTVDLPSVTSIGNTAFRNCSELTSITLINTNIATLSNTNAFQGTPIANGTGHIYVPDDLVDQYKTATNWSTYADQILPLSQRP